MKKKWAQMTQRNKNDQYFTPPWVTKILLDRIQGIQGCEVLEPANGLGGISDVLKAAGIDVVTSDLDPDFENCDICGEDYFTSEIGETAVDWIITNPPYSCAPQFVRRALNQAQVGVAMLLRLSFLEPANTRPASKRVDLLTESFPVRHDDENKRLQLMEILVLPRIRFSGPKKDTVTTAWFVWKSPDHYNYPSPQQFAVIGPEECKKYGR